MLYGAGPKAIGVVPRRAIGCAVDPRPWRGVEEYMSKTGRVGALGVVGLVALVAAYALPGAGSVPARVAAKSGDKAKRGKSDAAKPASTGAWSLVHDWPQLPDGFVFGQVPGLAIDSHNHVWVFNRGYKPVVCLDGTTGKIVTSWGEGKFTRAHGLRIDAQDNLWLSDKDEHLLLKYSHDGKLLLTVGTKGKNGADATHFDGPADFAFAKDGSIYVADGYQNNRIVKLGPDGKFLMSWGKKGTGPGEFDVPHGVAMDGDGRVFVADRTNRRVQIFDGAGKFLDQWKSDEIGRPWGVTVAPDGGVWVVDGGDAYKRQNKADPNPGEPDRARVMRVDPHSGKVLESVGSFGRYEGQFIWPHSVAVGQDGTVYVAEVHTGMRVQKFVKR